MKNLLLSGLAALVWITTNSYADRIQMAVINESSQSATLTIQNSKTQTVALGSANVKMFTADYKYPATILIQGYGQSSKPCHWTMPLIGKQTISAITVNISTDKSTNTQSCLLSWQ
jgi:hypothetical protein